MLRAWPLLFFVIPLVEIYFLVQVGEEIGAGMTVLLVIITAIIGVTMLRQQGLRTLLKANQAMQAGQMPAQELFDGFILAAVGILLVTPGFFTDAVGFVLLVPTVRKALLRGVLSKLVMQVNNGHASAHYRSSSTQYTTQQEEAELSRPKHTIDGDFKRED